MATTLTHKVRNPKDLTQWLELWTAEITKDSSNNINYTINPSKEWKIPITNVTVENGENIVTSNISNNDIGIAYIDKNKITKVIKADRGLSINNDNTIGHSNTITSGLTSYSSSGSSVTIPTIQYDDYGHIKNVGTKTHTINNLNIDSLNNNEFSPNTAHEGEPSNAKTFNNTIIDIIKDNTSKLTFNSADKDGIVKAVIEEGEQEQLPNYHANEVWASDSNSEPAWRKITANMFDSSTEINANNLPKNSSDDGRAGIIDEAPTKTGTDIIEPNMVWGTDSDESDNNNKPGWMSLINKKIAIAVHYDEKNKTLSIGNSTNPWENYSIAEVYDSTETYYVKTPSGPFAGSYVTQDVSDETDFNNQKGNLYYRDYNWFFILSTDSKVELERVTE